MQDLLDSAPCGFLTFAEDGNVVAVNTTLLDLLGFRREEVVGRHIEQLFNVGTRIFYQTHWFPLLRLHGRAEEVFLMLRTKSGEALGMLVYAQRRADDGAGLFDCVFVRVRERTKYEDELLRARRVAEESNRRLQETNEQLELQAVELELQQQQLRDQTELLERAAEEMTAINEALQTRTEEAEHLRTVADEANQAKSAFLATMSHELRTPLNAIGGYLQILQLEIRGPLNDAQHDIIARIEKSSRHLLRLINEVLNLARIEAGHVEYRIRDVAASELVAAIRPMIDPQFAAKQIEFHVDVDPTVIVRADAEKVEQVLLNLLSNAVKFTAPGGRVDLIACRSGRDEREVHLEVRDTGIGIPAEQLESVFQPFVQVDASNTRTVEGSGLGLAISRDLARGMNGDLWATSTVGVGSSFTLCLPAAVDQPSARIASVG